MTELDVHWQWKQGLWAGIALARENVWSRAARRKRILKDRHPDSNSDAMEIDELHEDSPGEDDITDKVALMAKISVDYERILVRWLKGFDPIIFESFCGMMKRSTQTAAIG